MRKKILVITTTVLVIILSSFVFLMIRAYRPLTRAQAEALEIAQSHTDLAHVEAFYWFTRGDNYFTLVGTDSSGTELIVLIPQSGEKLTVLAPSEGLTEDEAVAKAAAADDGTTVQKATLGIIDDRVTWEVISKNTNQTFNYYLIDFKTGEIYDLIKSV